MPQTMKQILGFLLLILPPACLAEATLLGGNSSTSTTVEPKSEILELPPYQPEYPDALPDQEVAVPVIKAKVEEDASVNVLQPTPVTKTVESGAIEMPPYKSEYPEAIADQDVAVETLDVSGTSLVSEPVVIEIEVKEEVKQDPEVIPAVQSGMQKTILGARLDAINSKTEIVVEVETQRGEREEEPEVKVIEQPKIEVITPKERTSIMNPHIQEKKKEVVEVITESVTKTIQEQVDRTGLLNSELWKKGMEDARRKVQVKSHQVVEEAQDKIIEKVVDEIDNEENTNLLFRFFRRIRDWYLNGQ